MKLYPFLFVFCLIYMNDADEEEANVARDPQDVNDFKPDSIESAKTSSNNPLPNDNDVVKINETITISPGNESSQTTTPLVVKAENEKKDELLTGKEEASLNQNTEAPSETSTVAEVVANNEVNKIIDANESDKKIAAPEFEVKHEVEGGKGEEDPDANVDKPAQVDPPKDEADGRAKEDRETVAAGAEGLHEAVEEARGNLAVGVKPIETNDEQTLESAPVARPFRTEYQGQPGFEERKESTGFMTYFVFGSVLVFLVYMLQHNKKKILGLMFEGKRSTSRRGGAKYRRLSQNEQD